MKMTGSDRTSLFPPLDEATFARLMQGVEPFETRPWMAVAVSGGPDSMALCVLLARWTRRNGGETVALTVDHGLRLESAAEARLVGKRVAALGVPHHVLTRTGPAPRANIQATVRTARYQLLEDWCRRQGILHLALAHHEDDQAETVLLRLARGSGVQGLAAMAPVVYRRDVRLVRPLLTVARQHLRETCIAHDVAWVEDKYNQNDIFARVRIRNLLPVLKDVGLDAARLASTATNMARAKAAIWTAMATILARSASLHPFGFACLDLEALVAAPAEVALRTLACLLTVVGGNTYPPRLRRLEALREAILAQTFPRGRTLAGCLIRPDRNRLLLCREPAAVVPPIAVAAGTHLHWDGRFALTISAAAPAGLRVGALGEHGWRAVVTTCPALARLPSCAGHALPALYTIDGEVQVILPTGETACLLPAGERRTIPARAVFAPDIPALVQI